MHDLKWYQEYGERKLHGSGLAASRGEILLAQLVRPWSKLSWPSMKRDPRLQGLSADHHHALVLARRIAREAGAAEISLLAASVRRAFDLELAPHFAIEEEYLIPALRDAGEGELADRTLADHAALRRHLAEAERGDSSALLAFAQLLGEHVRFEEHHLFPACEARLPDAVLARIAVRSPSRA